MNMDLQIEFLYFPDCPSHEDALQRLRDVLAAENQAARIVTYRVETEDEAQHKQFIGSPTIRMNGQDIVPPPAEAPFALSCRVYQHEDGRFSSMPSEETIRRAIHQALATDH